MYATLHLTLGCNLRCVYCYAGSKANTSMTPAIALKAIEFLLQQADDFLNVTLFGGEPLLRFDLVKSVIEAADQLKPSKRLTFHMVTNGTLLTDEIIDYFRRRDILYTLSFDGDRASQDANRRTAGGKGSFDLLMERVPKILAANPYIKLNMVVTPRTARNLASSVRFLRETGFRYLDIQPDFGATWDAKSAKILRKQCQKVADYWVDCHRKRTKIYVNFIDDKIQVHARHREREGTASPCTAGQATLSIAPSGRIYPCVQFVKDDDPADLRHSLGDIWTGIDASRRTSFRGSADQPPSECTGCAFFRRCQNYCACANWQSTGNPGRPSPFLCEYERTVIPIADRAGAALWRERNELFISKIYNDAWPILSYIEEQLGQRRTQSVATPGARTPPATAPDPSASPRVSKSS